MRLFSIAAILFVATPSLAQEPPPPPSPTKTATGPLTAETFAATPFMENPQLSPNGRFIVARVATATGQSMAVISLIDKTIPIVGVGLDNTKLDVDYWRWVNDDWLVVVVSIVEQIYGEDVRLRRVASLERATGKLTLLARKATGYDAGDVIWIARDGTPRILLGVQQSVYVDQGYWPSVSEVDVSNGKMKVVAPSKPGVLDYYADGNGVVRLGYGYDRDRRVATLVYRSNAKENFRTLDRANLAKDERLTFPNLFLPEADKALTFDNSEGFTALYELDLKTMTRGKKIFGVDGYDIDGLMVNNTSDGVAGVSWTENRGRTQYMDPDLAAVQAGFDKSIGVGRAHISSLSADRKKMIVTVGGPDQAGAYYYFDREGNGALNRFAFVDEKLKLTKFAPVTTIRYKARDGVMIPAVLTLPKLAPKNLPLIVLPHGGPAARDSESWDWWVQFLAAKGYAVIQPNYRGSTGFGKAHYELGDQQWGLKMQDDLNDAITHLAKEGIADPKRVCMVGASYGGYAAMRAAQRDGALFRCAISYAGVSDLAAIVRFDRDSFYGKEYVSYFKDKAPDFNAVSPLRFPEQFSIPILIMHGKNDLRVPVAQSRNMAAKLKAAGKDHIYIEQPLGDHHFSRAEDRLQFLKEMESFLAKHNPAN